jgi:hypothetical protein
LLPQIFILCFAARLLALNPGQASDTDIVVEDYMYVMGNIDVVIVLATLTWQY